MDDAGKTRLTLGNRYGYGQWLEEVAPHCWKYCCDENMPPSFRHGGSEEKRYFDPPGGPMICEGEPVSFRDHEQMWVAAIRSTGEALHVWLTENEAGIPDVVAMAGAEKRVELSEPPVEEAVSVAEMVGEPTTVTASAAVNLIYGEETETTTGTSGGYCSFTQDGSTGVDRYEYPRQLTIGMIGKAGSGKDTVADYLVSNYSFAKIALADPLKAAVKTIFAIDDAYMYDREKREEELPDWPGWTVRKLLQFVGTELFRTHIDQDIWVKNVILRAKSQQKTVISDVRFPNEVEIPRKVLGDAGHDVIFIKVVREGVNGTPSGIEGHESEAHDLEGDFTIVNDGSIEDLYRKTRDVMAEIQSMQ